LVLALLALALGAAIGVTQAFAAQEEGTQPAGDSKKASTSGSAASPSSSSTTTYAKVMDAVVKSDGTLVRGKGATGARQLKLANGEPATGEYEVDFGRKVSNCAYVATIGKPGDEGVAASGEITVATRTGNSSAVYVNTNDSSGDNSDRSFHLQVAC
jgi:hypothetical protein